jgi:hypothetical protein
MGSGGGSPVEHYVSFTNIAIRALHLPVSALYRVGSGKDEEESCHQCGKRLPYEAMRGRDCKLSRGYEYGREKLRLSPFFTSFAD